MVTVEDVLAVRRRLVETPIAQQDAFGRVDALFPDRLESAVSRQRTEFGGVQKYTKVHEIAATLFYGLAMSHSFENGNKRTALVTLLVFIERAQMELVDTTEDDLYDLVTELVEHRITIYKNEARTPDAEVAAVARWLRARMRSVGHGDRKPTFKQLRRLLVAQGCTFEDPDNNFVKIRHGDVSVVTGFPKHNFDVGVNEVKRIRKELGLANIQGVRAREFYDIDESVDDFVREYRGLLDRLSEL